MSFTVTVSARCETDQNKYLYRINLVCLRRKCNHRLEPVPRSSVGAHLPRSTFVLRKTNAVAFVPYVTNGTLSVYPKKLMCVTNVLRACFLRVKKSHLFHVFVRDRKAHLSHVIFYELFVTLFPRHKFFFRIEVRRFTSCQM
jgi:hypothetical protein